MTQLQQPSVGFDRKGIEFAHAIEFPGWDLAPEYLAHVLATNDVNDVLEVGSGAEPTVAASDLPSLDLQSYVTNDIDAAELEKAPQGFDTLHADLTASPNPLAPNSFDLIFSRMVNEHVKDGEQYHRNLYDALRPGGLAVHCYATLYALPMLVNKVTPHWLSERLVNFFHPRLKANQGVFPAHYSWSRGPTDKMVADLGSIGYDIERFTGYFGHYYYAAKLGPLHTAEMLKTQALVKRPNAHLCAYGVLELRKPAA